MITPRCCGCARGGTRTWATPGTRSRAGCTRCCATWSPAACRRRSPPPRPPGIIEQAAPAGAVGQARRDLAAELLADLRRLDAQLAESKKKLAAVVRASGTSVTGLFGVGPVVAAIVIGDASTVTRFPSRDHFAAWNGTAPVEVSSGGRKIYRLSRRGNRRVNYAIHIAAVTQIRYKHSPGRAYYDKKIAEGKTPKEALRALKRRISDAIYARLLADARKRQRHQRTREGNRGTTLTPARPASTPNAGSSDKPLPGRAHHPTTTARSPGSAGHSPAAATLPSARPQVQVERPQRSEDERPGGAPRRRPYSAAGKAPRPLVNHAARRPPHTPPKRPPQPLDTKRIRSGAGRLACDVTVWVQIWVICAPTVTAARRPVVPLHGTRWFSGGPKSFDARCVPKPGSTARLVPQCRRRLTPVPGWSAAWTHDRLV